jgi:hypothetical protein
MTDTTWFWVSYVIQNPAGMVFGETVTDSHPFDWNLEMGDPNSPQTKINILHWRVISQDDVLKFRERLKRNKL